MRGCCNAKDAALKLGRDWDKNPYFFIHLGLKSRQAEKVSGGRQSCHELKCNRSAPALHSNRSAVREDIHILEEMLQRDGRRSIADAAFEFLPIRAELDLGGFEDMDIFAHS